MSMLFDLLAQATSMPATSMPAGAPQGAPSPLDLLRSPFMLIVLFMIVLFWMNARSRKKEQRKFQDMLDALKRNDRILTIGGIIGTVVDVREGEVVVKVDESNNTKVRFSRSAIKEVLQDAPPAETK